MQNNVALR